MMQKKRFQITVAGLLVVNILISIFILVSVHQKNQNTDTQENTEQVTDNTPTPENNEKITDSETETVRYPELTTSSQEKIETEALLAEIEVYLGSELKHYGIYYKNMTTGDELKHQVETEFPVASLIKLPIVVLTLMEIDKGNVTLDTPITVLDHLKQEGQEDQITKAEQGTTFPLRVFLEDAIRISSNTAQYHLRNFVQESYDGEWLTYIIRDELGLNPYFDDPLIATPQNVMRLYTWLYEESKLSEDSNDFLLELMKTTGGDLRLGIPAGVGETEHEVANKVGFLFGGIEGDVYNDAAIVYGEDYDYILVILNDKAPPYPDGVYVIQDIADIVESYH